MDLKIPKLDDLKDRLGIKDDFKDRLGIKDDFKERLGFKDSQRRASSASQEDSYDDFYSEDYGEYGFDDSADYAQDSSSSAAKTTSFAPQMPKLVTADDVRAHTQYTPSMGVQNEEEVAEQKPAVAEPFAGQEYQGEDSVQYADPASAAKTGAFAAQDLSAVPSMPAVPEVSSEPRVVARATRILTVIKPESYADAERIAKILKSGDVAILSLRNTPDALGKRILDFSFGVACALDARVECVSGHVFALTRGAGLTDGETERLRDQGLM